MIISTEAEFMALVDQIKYIKTFKNNDQSILVELAPKKNGFDAPCPTNNAMIASYILSYARSEMQNLYKDIKAKDPTFKIAYGKKIIILYKVFG